MTSDRNSKTDMASVQVAFEHAGRSVMVLVPEIDAAHVVEVLKRQWSVDASVGNAPTIVEHPPLHLPEFKIEAPDTSNFGAHYFDALYPAPSRRRDPTLTKGPKPTKDERRARRKREKLARRRNR